MRQSWFLTSSPEYKLFTVMLFFVLVLCSVPLGKDTLQLWLYSHYCKKV